MIRNKETIHFSGHYKGKLTPGDDEERMKKLSLSVEQSPICILLTDNKGLIEYVNPRFEELTGYRRADVIGKKPGIVSSGYHPKEFYEELWREIRAGRQWKGVFHNRKKDGSIYYESAIITPIQNEKGEITNFMGIKEDITARLIAEQKLKESIITRDKLFSIISHDLRGPVGNMPPLLDIIINNMVEDEEAKTELLVSMRKAAYNIKDLLENLLKWASLQTGSISFSTVDFNIRDAANWEVDLYSSLATEKKIILENRIPNDLTAYADIESFRLIIRNLIGNAIKYSYPDGKISIKASPKGGMVLISVEDQGVGMTNDVIEKILKSDSFISTYGTKNEKGTGLGLNLCKEFIRKNGGEIFIESAPGNGTKISFTLNRREVVHLESLQSEKISEQLSEKILEGRKILFIDDDEFNKVYTSALFGKWGVDYILASNGMDGIKHLRDSTFDIILIDLEMPVMDGMETVRFIREEMNFKLPIVAISANDSQKYIRRVLKCGFNNYIIKPYSEDQLLDIIVKLLQSYKLKPSRNTEPGKEERVADLNKIRQLLRGDNAATADVLQKFLDIVPSYYQSALEAFDKSDMKMLHSHIHKLKSSIAIVACSKAVDNINLINSLSEKGKGGSVLRREMKIITKWFPQLCDELKQELEVMKSVL